MAETEFKYDVFISYTSTNKEWVRKIFVPTLEKAGLKCCDYYRDFDAGAPIVKEMENAVLNSRKTILVLSPAYLERAWTEFENLMLQTIDPANQERRLLPVIIEKCELPLRIKYMNCINFANPDDIEIEWQRLSRALGVTSTLDTKTPATGSRDTWHLAHPYPMPPNFTGRVAEQTMLDDWLADNTNRLFILRALGGFGKSALSWQWINTHVNPAEWTKLVFWSFYEGDASFEHFIEETLKYLNIEPPQGGRPQVDALLKAMGSQKILLIMDGFERALRAYSSMNAAYQGDESEESPSPSGRGARGEGETDCVNINAEIFLKSVCSLPNIKSKVLMTTRLTPRAIKPRGEFTLGCREVELTAMQKADAVEFFHKQKIKGTHAEIEATCAPYGYHPLSLRLLAGRILKDFENPADIVVAQKLKIDGDIIQQKHHVLEVSYNSLPEHEQKLLSMIACFRSPVELKTLEAIEENNKSLQDDLHDLVARGLLYFDEKSRRFDLHPIVRHYAYEIFLDKETTHRKLAEYFQKRTDEEISEQYRNLPKVLRNMLITEWQKQVKAFEDLAPIIELYHHTVRAGELDKAYLLFRDRLTGPLYLEFGAYHTIIELLSSLFLKGEKAVPSLQKKEDCVDAIDWLCAAYGGAGSPNKAIDILKLHTNHTDIPNKILLGLLENISDEQAKVGSLHSAEVNLHRLIELCRETENEEYEGTAHYQNAIVLAYTGQWEDSENKFNIAESIKKKTSNIQAQGVISVLRARRALLIFRDIAQMKINHKKIAIQFAQRALELSEEDARSDYPVERDFVRAHWILGAAYRLDNQFDSAEQHLSESLARSRASNIVEHEADILLDLARLRYDQKNYEEAKSLADEALLITERCGYVLQGADVNLFLAQYALEQEQDKVKAKEYAKKAKKLATCDGPPYYYKVAYEEAERFLERLKDEG